MDRKPFITYDGEPEQFNAIQVELLQSLPRDKVEWRRSFGRAKMIKVDVNFVPFNADLLPHDNDPQHARMLLQLPMLHVYFTDCPDTDAYRIVTKEKIAIWLNLLRERNIMDWMIVLVEPANPRRSKSKLLPKFSVLDKIKNDFCSRQTDRLIVLHEPNNPVPNSKTMESWAAFVAKLRHLFVQAYNRTFTKYEDVVRKERERRVESDWNFCSYFLLQEELALAFESMDIKEDALVQYDELDALFTQFIINSQAGQSVSWLSPFTDSCNCWDGLNLSDTLNKELRDTIKHGKPSLLDLRNYLFSRQCALLFKMGKPTEVAHRSQPFMHTCVQELDMLEVPMPPGSVACWVFLTCVEVLQKYEKMSSAYNMETHSHYTANLWVYAQRKLAELGALCGLMPDMEGPSSDHLQTVVDLLSGMGKSSPATQVENSPNQKLREALSSTEAFQRQYLELSELAMGNFKHIGRQRSVALIGTELATFHQMKKDYQKAETFLEDALRFYEKEGWKLLALDTRQKVAETQKKLTDLQKYLHTCSFLMGDPLLEKKKRNHYFEEMMATAKKISANFKEGTNETEVTTDEMGVTTDETGVTTDETGVTTDETGVTTDETEDITNQAEVIIPFHSAFALSGITILDNVVTVPRNEDVRVEVEIFSRLSSPITLRTLGLRFQEEIPNDPGSPVSRGSVKSLSSTILSRQLSQDSADFFVVKDLSFPTQRDVIPDVHAEIRVEESTKKPVAWVRCRNISAILQRQDSSNSWGKSKGSLKREEFVESAELTDVELRPGHNALEFIFKSEDNGLFLASQLIMELLDGVLFLLNLESLGPMIIEVSSPEPRLTINIPDELFVGIPHEISISITTGHSLLKKGDSLPLCCSDGLFIYPKQCESYAVEREGDACVLRFLEDVECNQESVFTLTILSTIGIHLEEGGDDESINHIGRELELEIACPWLETVTQALHFNYPLTVTHRCHTIKTKKLVQVSVTNVAESVVRLSSIDLEVEDINAKDLTSIKQPTDKPVISPKQTHSFVWFLPEAADVTSCKSCLFSLSFVSTSCPPSSPLPPEGRVQYTFGIADLETKYIVSSSVTPGDGREMCSMGSPCYFTLDIKRTDDTSGDQMSLLYEVQTLGTWVMCGKNKGIVAMHSGSKVTSVQLEMLPLVSGYIRLPDVKLSEYPTGEGEDIVVPAGGSGDRETERTKPKLRKDVTLQPLNSNQVYYGSRATQIHVFPECNTSSVEVALS